MRPRITFWRAVFVAIVLAGAVATWVRFTRGLGAATHLSDTAAKSSSLPAKYAYNRSLLAFASAAMRLIRAPAMP